MVSIGTNIALMFLVHVLLDVSFDFGAVAAFLYGTNELGFFPTFVPLVLL